MKIRPLGEKILVKRMAAEEKTASGIYLPESAKEKPQQAKVIALGSGKLLDDGKRAPFTVKKGDVVILGKWGGQELPESAAGEKDVLLINEDEVLAVVE
jgi:chaperonin GroES